MSENKGKAKVKSKSKSKSTMKSAGKNKAAVMNSRNPKKPMAISGDTMSNYAMYKKGGKVKKSLPKAGNGIIVGNQTAPKDNTSTRKVTMDPVSETNTAAYMSGRMDAGDKSIKEPSSGFGYAGITQNPFYEKGYQSYANRSRKKGGATYKKGGVTKAKKFAALAPPYNKATAADRIAGAKKNSKKK